MNGTASPTRISGPGWPDARGWIGVGSFTLTIAIIAMILFDRSLLRDDFFKVIATAIILNGWNSGPLAWAYAATQGGQELANRNADLVQKQAENSPPIKEPEA